MKKRTILMLSLLTGLTLTAYAVKTAVIANDNDVTGIIPFEVSNMPSGRLEDIMYNRLFKYDQKMNIVPVLAEGYQMLDDVTIRIPLKKGVKFHNGEEMTSEDVVFGFEMWRDRKIKAHMMDSIDKAVAVDKYTVDLHLKYPFGPLLGNIIAGYSVVNKKEITENPNYKERAIGTGPYKFVEWIPGDRIVVEAFNDYWGGKPEIEKLIYKPVIEVSNRTMGLEAGDLQISYEIDPIDKETVVRNPKLQYFEIPSTRVNYLTFNTQKGILKDAKVRNALASAIDRDSIVEAILMGNGKKAESLVPPGVFGYKTDIEATEYNPEKAKAMLKESGIPEGTKMSLMTADRGANINIAQIIQANFKEVGIDLTIDILEWGTYLQHSGEGKHEMALAGWSTGTGDSDYALYPLLHSSAMGNPGNRSFFSNAEMDQLLDSARKSMDRSEREKMYHKVQEIANREMPVVPLYYGVYNLAVRKDLENIVMSADGRHELQNIKVKK